MQRDEVLQWFQEHPDAVHGDVEDVLTRCERAVRRHAREDAWVAAKRYVEQRRHEDEDRIGARASEAYVAREVCRELADELQRHEPRIEAGDEEHLAGGPVRAAVGAEGWAVLIPWIMEMAREEEHRAWLEITRFTHERAKALIRSHHLSDDTDLDHAKCFGEVAQQIERLLERDYERRAFPH